MGTMLLKQDFQTKPTKERAKGSHCALCARKQPATASHEPVGEGLLARSTHGERSTGSMKRSPGDPKTNLQSGCMTSKASAPAGRNPSKLQYLRAWLLEADHEGYGLRPLRN